jgi:hypothetical protein
MGVVDNRKKRVQVQDGEEKEEGMGVGVGDGGNNVNLGATRDQIERMKQQLNPIKNVVVNSVDESELSSSSPSSPAA